MRSSFRAALCVLAGAAALPGSALAAVFSMQIDPIDAPFVSTFSGRGTIDFAGPTSDPADIGLLSLQIATMGSDAPGGGTPVTHVFTYGASDIDTVTGLAAAGGGLVGTILFQGKAADAGGVFMDDLTLDFTAGLAGGFCFEAGGQECIFGGGTSTGVEASLRAAPVPLPASLPLLALAAGGLGCLARRRADT